MGRDKYSITCFSNHLTDTLSLILQKRDSKINHLDPTSYLNPPFNHLIKSIKAKVFIPFLS